MHQSILINFLVNWTSLFAQEKLTPLNSLIQNIDGASAMCKTQYEAWVRYLEMNERLTLPSRNSQSSWEVKKNKYQYYQVS